MNLCVCTYTVFIYVRVETCMRVYKWICKLIYYEYIYIDIDYVYPSGLRDGVYFI